MYKVVPPKHAADNLGEFSVANKVSCCNGPLCPAMQNCEDGFAKMRPCAAVKAPIKNKNGEHVAWVVQTVPLIPVNCCMAELGPTVQMSIVGVDSTKTFTQEEIAQMALFMFTVKPNMPGSNSPGGPARFVGQLLGGALGKVGWTLGMSSPGVVVDYLTLQEFFNGEVAGIGNLVDAIRGMANKAKDLARSAAKRVVKKVTSTGGGDDGDEGDEGDVLGDLNGLLAKRNAGELTDAQFLEMTQELAGSYVVEGAGEEKDGEVPNPTAEPTKAMV